MNKILIALNGMVVGEFVGEEVYNNLRVKESYQYPLDVECPDCFGMIYLIGDSNKYKDNELLCANCELPKQGYNSEIHSHALKGSLIKYENEGCEHAEYKTSESFPGQGLPPIAIINCEGCNYFNKNACMDFPSLCGKPTEPYKVNELMDCKRMMEDYRHYQSLSDTNKKDNLDTFLSKSENYWGSNVYRHLEELKDFFLAFHDEDVKEYLVINIEKLPNEYLFLTDAQMKEVKDNG